MQYDGTLAVGHGTPAVGVDMDGGRVFGGGIAKHKHLTRQDFAYGQSELLDAGGASEPEGAIVQK